MNDQARESIWSGDRLGRAKEAERIEEYITREVQTFAKLGRNQSIVLGIDAPYGRGKTWFLERLARQLAQSHPVAFIDAWADDVGDEPLTAFMAAIEEALAPYMKNSAKLRDHWATTKAAALPVMGKLVSGALVKALTKVAGDEIEGQLGDTIEDAIAGARETSDDDEDGAAAQAMEASLETLGKEIESLVDRRGAAMLESYRRKKKSRLGFRNSVERLIAAVDDSEGETNSPLIVVIDELDRCRPHYAIKMLEEIKHFFEIPNVVFLIGLHGNQLSKSVNAVYGAEFDSDSYLRRFFTRRYALAEHPTVELTAHIFETWKMDEGKFVFPDPTPTIAEGYPLTKPRTIGLILSQWNVTPREVYAIMDALRLFVDGWEHDTPIEPISLLSLLARHVRGLPLNFVAEDDVKTEIQFAGMSWTQDAGRPEKFTVKKCLDAVRRVAWSQIGQHTHFQSAADPALNYVYEIVEAEARSRRPRRAAFQPHFAFYIPKILELSRFFEGKREG